MECVYRTVKLEDCTRTFASVKGSKDVQHKVQEETSGSHPEVHLERVRHV